MTPPADATLGGVTDDLDLIARIRTAIDADEADALAAGGDTWRGTDDGVFHEDASRSPGAFAIGPYGHLADEVIHIARQDPAATLRRVRAHRRVLDRHAPQDEGMGALPPDLIEYGEFGPVCQRCGTPGEYAVAWPCGDVLDLADAYGIDTAKGDMPTDSPSALG